MVMLYSLEILVKKELSQANRKKRIRSILPTFLRYLHQLQLPELYSNPQGNQITYVEILLITRDIIGILS